jgi:predicted enzyme related to lactoylglutathione lyase
MPEYEVTDGSIAHVELISEDVDTSVRFYEAAFGWETAVDEERDYTMWRAPNAPSGASSTRASGRRRRRRRCFM